MNPVEFRKLLEQKWEEIQEDAISSKDPNLATYTWLESYKNFDDNQRLVADQVIAEWVTSKDTGKRFDALTLVEEFNIRLALPQLCVLEAELMNNTGPEARYALKKVRRIIKLFDAQ